jgi:hypothetical protein
VHAVAETHEIPLSEGPSFAVVGVAWMAQELPFQCSISACLDPLLKPTAVQLEAEVQETASRSTAVSALGLAPLGLITSWTVQVLPFQ